MASRQKRSNSIYSAIIALVVTSAWSVASLYGSSPAEESDGRRPASIRSAGGGASVGMDVLRLGCWDKPPEKIDATRARWVRLLGTGCGSRGPIEVTNRTNGFVATVFDVNEKDRTTDFIPLARGQNQVEIVVGAEGRRRRFSVTLEH